jgi:hypothetical protein
MATLLQGLYAFGGTDSWLAEAASWYRTMPEKLVRCLWFDPRWRPPALRTLDGQEVVVHSPGRWNLQAGPDFQHAVLTFANGERCRGDVEVHRYTSGWTTHRHHLDARYNQVILHVVLWNDRHTTTVRRADGQLVPQVVLEPCLPRSLAEYQADISLEDYPSKNVPFHGRCYEVLRMLVPQEARAFLERAGDLRLQRRMWRWAQRATEVALPQVMYEAVLRALGATGYRQHFQELARRVQWQELQGCLDGVAESDRGLAAEALLLGLAGILPPSTETVQEMDEETRRYLRNVQGYWLGFPPAIRQRAQRRAAWQQPHIRPANTAERRLAGMAQLLAQYHGTNLLDAGVAWCSPITGRDDKGAARTLCRALTGMFDLSAPSYWTPRARLGGRKGKAQRLIGASRALTVVVDAVLPVLGLFAHTHNNIALQASLLACYQAAPRLPDNHLLRYMSQRLLGRDPSLLSLITGARMQQGMLQVFYDFCDNDEGDCQGCAFPLLTRPAP